jgi:hypothetical protein
LCQSYEGLLFGCKEENYLVGTIEVAITLDLQAEEAIKYYKEFLMLLGITELICPNKIGPKY